MLTSATYLTWIGALPFSRIMMFSMSSTGCASVHSIPRRGHTLKQANPGSAVSRQMRYPFGVAANRCWGFVSAKRLYERSRISIEPFRWNSFVSAKRLYERSRISIEPFRWNSFVSAKRFYERSRISIKPFRWNSFVSSKRFYESQPAIRSNI